MSSARETFRPRSKRQDQRDSPITQSEFGGGLVRNAPHDEIPETALADLVNAHAYPKEVIPRLGTRIVNFTVPSTRTGITATKAGTIITATGFTEADVSCYFVWPDEDIHDEIIEYISATQVRVHRTNNKDATDGCWIHGRLNLWQWHSTQDRMVWQWGEKVYTNVVTITNTYVVLGTLTEAICLSRYCPSNTISDWSEMDDYGVLYNSRGIFLIDFETDTIFQKNTPIPNRMPADEAREMDSKYRYDVLYSMTRLAGQGIRSRVTASTPLLQESGTTDISEQTDPARDNAIVWTSKRIDRGIKTNGRLVGGTLAAAQQNPFYWAGLNNASFRWNVNGREEEFVCDFSITTGAAITSLTDVAIEIQRVLRLVFYAATCEYDADNTRFILSTGEESDSICNYVANGTGGTNIAALMCLTAIAGATVDNANIYSEPHVFGPFYVPEYTDGGIERHWTHYTQYRTPDIGPDGVSPRVGPSGEILPPLKFGWCQDVRVAGAMYASMADDGLVTAEEGTFEIYDVGTNLEWEDGEITVIIQYVDETQVYVSAEYFDSKPLQACAIGGGRVIRASQSEYTVTREGGGVFTSADVGAMVWWSTDYYSIIVEFVDANTVLVRDSSTRDTQGLTIAPVSRMINDVTNDESLRARFDELYVGALRNRFWTRMPNVNIGRVCPGFMITAQRDAPYVYYCQLGTSLKHMSGYYLSNRQKGDKIDEAIQHIEVMPNKVIIWCKNETWMAPTNDPKIQTLPQFGEAYAVLFFDMVDNEQGITDVGSVVFVKTGLLQMVLSDNSVRQFDGFKYGPDMTVTEAGQDMIKKDLKETWGTGCSLYDNKLGYVLWRVSRETA